MPRRPPALRQRQTIPRAVALLPPICRRAAHHTSHDHTTYLSSSLAKKSKRRLGTRGAVEWEIGRRRRRRRGDGERELQPSTSARLGARAASGARGSPRRGRAPELVAAAAPSGPSFERIAFAFFLASLALGALLRAVPVRLQPPGPDGVVAEFAGENLESCDVFDGIWVPDERYPLYNSSRCPFAERVQLPGQWEEGRRLPQVAVEAPGCDLPRSVPVLCCSG
ncbi:hypothetical protein HU200_007054 [Digitaria exilis]|uniref:Trichome birefringence-like N-terminal domain-containing protein n=1 Tax=Digitaria exilis TaxID=1010633 RepID=A0A835KRC8_9POAL|nr:hypothetical protein HU200_007054 [Digitaria exilis]